MPVECLVSVSGDSRSGANPYIFEHLPRIGDKVTLPDGAGNFAVLEVIHYAAETDGTPGITYLTLQKA